MADLLAESEEEADWIIDGLLCKGGLSILAGKPKAGKSTLARCVAFAVSTGQSILNRVVTQGTVVYIGLEDRRREIRNHFRLLGADGNENLFIHAEPLRPGSEPDCMNDLEAVVNAHHPSMIVIDTLFRFCRVRDVSSYSEVIEALDPFLFVARDANTHILLIHHAPKAEKDGLDSLLGSVAIGGSCDTGLILTRKPDGTRTLKGVQRYGDDLPETILTMDPESRAVALGDTMARSATAELEGRILDMLGGELMTEFEIRIALGGHGGRVGDALRGLFNDGRVSRIGNGVKNDPFKYSFPVSP